MEDERNNQNSILKVLNILGLIAAPTVLVGVGCAIVQYDTKTTAIATLFAMIFTTILLFRKYLNQKVQSSVVIIITVAISVIFFFGYKNILLKDTGLIKYWKPSSKIIGTIPDLIQESKHEIWFYGTNFRITAIDDKKLIINKLSEGLKIKYLIYNPYSSITGAVANDFDQSKQELENECISGLKSLMQLDSLWNIKKQACTMPGELEIRVYNNFPRLRAYIFDPTEKNSDCIYIPYLHQTNSPELPAFQFKNQEDGVFQDYFTSIHKLWETSSSLKDLRLQHPELSN